VSCFHTGGKGLEPGPMGCELHRFPASRAPCKSCAQVISKLQTDPRGAALDTIGG